jgi:hypothetical protein
LFFTFSAFFEQNLDFIVWSEGDPPTRTTIGQQAWMGNFELDLSEWLEGDPPTRTDPPPRTSNSFYCFSILWIEYGPKRVVGGRPSNENSTIYIKPSTLRVVAPKSIFITDSVKCNVLLLEIRTRNTQKRQIDTIAVDHSANQTLSLESDLNLSCFKTSCILKFLESFHPASDNFRQKKRKNYPRLV